MSRVTYSPTLTVRLLEVERTVRSLQSSGITGDPERVTRDLEGLLNLLADWNPLSLVCEDCGRPLPEYAVRRWYRPDPDTHVFDLLCRTCEGRREDAVDETRAHRAH
jgi:hypothetical protein